MFVLQAALEARGFSVFVGEAAIQGGEEWPETIAAVVRNCSAFVVLCSPTYGDTVWTKRELVMADNLRKPLIPVWHSGPYPPKAVEIFLGGKQRIPGGNFNNGYVAAKIAHSAVAEELIAALLRAGIVPGAPGTAAAAAVKVDSGKAAVGAAVDELAAWLTSACDFKAEELAGALPQLEAHGVTVRVDLKYVDEDVLRELQLKPLTIKKLRAGLAAMTAGAGAASATSDGQAAAQAFADQCSDIEQRAATDAGRAAALADSAAAVVASGMALHRGWAMAQERGCAALRNLAGGADFKEEDDKFALAVAVAGGLDAVLEALRAHPTHAGVQEAAFGALVRILRPPDNRVKAGSAGAIEAAVAALRAHPAHTGVQAAACWALRQMTVNDANEIKAGSAGAIEATVAALRAHPAHAALQEAACAALCNVTGNADNRVKAGSAGAIEAAVAALRAHPAHAGVQEAACRALRNITADNAANKVKAGSAGAIEAAVAALRAHPAHAGVQEEACSALRIMTIGNESLAVKAGSAGVIEAAVAALRAHPAHAGVQEQACGALANICLTRSDLRTRARGAGAVDALKATLARFPTGAVATQAQTALDKVTKRFF